jgi:gamma-glutamylcyclotransferase (GGCT)/AIG2-like uncharacterized protein YtfP
MRLFCYGTLQFPDVMQQVSGLHEQPFPAVLDNYACYGVRGEVFPGIVPEPGVRTAGVVYSGLGLAHLKRLDEFESDCYERRRVMVSDEQERSLETWAYVMRPDTQDLLTREPWDRELFRRLHLQAWLARSGG